MKDYNCVNALRWLTNCYTGSLKKPHKHLLCCSFALQALIHVCWQMRYLWCRNCVNTIHVAHCGFCCYVLSSAVCREHWTAGKKEQLKSTSLKWNAKKGSVPIQKPSKGPLSMLEVRVSCTWGRNARPSSESWWRIHLMPHWADSL